MFLHVHVLPWSSHSGFRCMHVSCSYLTRSSHYFLQVCLVFACSCVSKFAWHVCMVCMNDSHHIGFMFVMLSCLLCLSPLSFRLASRPSVPLIQPLYLVQPCLITWSVCLSMLMLLTNCSSSSHGARDGQPGT